MTDDHLPPGSIAFGDQAEAAIVQAGTRYAEAVLNEAGMSLSDLSEDEREVLALGIRAGAAVMLGHPRPMW